MNLLTSESRVSEDCRGAGWSLKFFISSLFWIVLWAREGQSLSYDYVFLFMLSYTACIPKSGLTNGLCRLSGYTKASYRVRTE